MDTLRINSIGSIENAQKYISQALETVPAYKKFLNENKKTGHEPFVDIPLTEKRTYMTQFPYEELIPGAMSENMAIFSSSGSSSKEPFYWAYSKAEFTGSASVSTFIQAMFSMDKKKTLMVIGLSLGSWVGGDLSSFVIKQAILHSKIQTSVITIGTDLEEIIKVIKKFEKFYDQILICINPTALTNLMLADEHNKSNLPFGKMSYIFTDEPFPEEFRIAIENRSHKPETFPVAFSFYGSADTGMFGLESPASIALRKLCHHNPTFAKALGIHSGLPSFLHCFRPDVYIESVNDELCITKWQGIPLLRYNLHDRCFLYSWVKTQEMVKNYSFSTPIEQSLAAIIAAAPPQFGDLIALFGRADRCIIIAGVKIYEFMLNELIESTDLNPYLTGLYKAKQAYEGSNSYIDLVVETKEGIKTTPELLTKIEEFVLQGLKQIESDFKDAHERILSPSVNILGYKLIKVRTVPWPTISSEAETSIKIPKIIP